MPYYYTDASREKDPHALPDVEVFEVTKDPDGKGSTLLENLGPDYTEPGWYWWSCSPGCLPDGEPSGPYAFEQEALEAARADAGFCPHGIPADERCDECPAPEFWAIRVEDGRFLSTATMVSAVTDRPKVPVWDSETACWTVIERYEETNDPKGESTLRPYHLTADEAREWLYGRKEE